MTTAKPRNRAPQPADLPGVAHNGPVAPDSRGLVLTPPDDLAWTRGPQGRHSLVPVHGGYAEPETPTTMRPCYLCGEPARPVQFLYATDLEYAVCGYPLDWGGDRSNVAEACLDRARAERAAVTELIAEPVAEEPPEPAPEPATKAPAAPRSRQERLAQAKAAALKEGTAKAAEAATEPPEGTDG